MNCPTCKAPGAYVSTRSVECTNVNCRHFKESATPLLTAKVFVGQKRRWKLNRRPWIIGYGWPIDDFIVSKITNDQATCTGPFSSFLTGDHEYEVKLDTIETDSDVSQQFRYQVIGWAVWVQKDRWPAADDLDRYKSVNTLADRGPCLPFLSKEAS